jgi:predicted nucleic acid-binding protein
MAIILWDASAIAKRYLSETGTTTVNALWTSGARHAMPLWCYAEVYAILTRRLNSGRLDQKTFGVQVLALQNEILQGNHITLLSAHDRIVLSGIQYIRAHSLNSSDAAILASFNEYRTISGLPNSFVVVSSDQRLIRAATAEGFKTVNPEVVDDKTALALAAS